jgi:hypothetical protein
MKTDTCGAGRVASNDHMIRVTTEFSNVLLNPLESLALVVESKVGRKSIAIAEKSINADTIMDAHNNHVEIASLDKTGSVDIGVCIRVETTPLNVEVHWKLLFA